MPRKVGPQPLYLGRNPAEPSGFATRRVPLNLLPHPPSTAPMDTRSVVARLETGAPVAALELRVELGVPGPLRRTLALQLAERVLNSDDGLCAVTLRDALREHGYVLGLSSVREYKRQALLEFHARGLNLSSKRSRTGELTWRPINSKEL